MQNDDDGSNTCNSSNNNNQMTQMDAVVEGTLRLPPDTSARVAKPKKTYPPPPPGKKYIFRKWTTINGKRVYAPPGRAIPILVDV